jgi:hypothetical protein
MSNKTPTIVSAWLEDGPLGQIIELGRKAMRQERSDELAFDLLGLDGVRLPLEPIQDVD